MKAKTAVDDSDTGQAIDETNYLLAIPGMLESIKLGMAEPFNTNSKELDWSDSE
ncbi:hypothetical protein ACSFA3_11220 [Variovorax sp. RHLX14]|uniref:hypothetical protein n=1 Tax=Variovorax sp. RHLX14 TaxID=1259731 RepID=UPI003F461C52